MFALLAPWTQHTDASRLLASDVCAALAACGLSQKAAALEMGLHPSDFNRQLAGLDPLNLWRLTALPSSFWMALCHRQAERIGAALLEPEQIALLRGAAAMGSRRMLKMLGRPSQERRIG
jgi:hypothetical protein